MHGTPNPNFSQLVCSAAPVQEAFALHRPTRLWWRLILLLHGKPVGSSLPPEEVTRRVADGFRFYACLYRLLGVVFVLLGPALYVCNVADTPSASLYWAGASLLAGIYLWGVSGLGYAGAASYRSGSLQSVPALIAFLVLIVAFLSLFVAAVSTVAQHATWLTPLPNLAAAGILFVFGIGSYLIEIVYLTTRSSSPDGFPQAPLSPTGL